ncbi:MAG: CRISPR-associated protein Cas4 [Eubacteriales bacterium]|nr:CRISPR-associated protein Cas4 [Eubacteriales bacterium]
MEETDISIRQIQHYMYCPHRWGLIEIGNIWVENYFVTKANLIHERVHDKYDDYSIRNKKVFTSVTVYNDEYKLYGVCDCIELVKSDTGVNINKIKSNDKYNLTIVEYKPNKPKIGEYTEEDLMQVFAQKICVDYVFNTDSDGVIYYSNQKERIKLPLKDNYDKYKNLLMSILSQINNNLKNGYIPPVVHNKHCNGCSLKEICMPKVIIKPKKINGV